MVHSSPEYTLIKRFYKGRKAHRSKVPLINHIDQGLLVLEHIGASHQAKLAYCLHPIIQSDVDMFSNFKLLKNMHPLSCVLATEYRSVANAYLSMHEIKHWSEIGLSPLKDVNDMLIADKVQNRRDFERFHKKIHPRSKALEEYFDNWFMRLGITASAGDLLRHVDKGQPDENCLVVDQYHGDAE